MDCIFINLDEARDRRVALETNFKRFCPASWRLTRFPALTPHVQQVRDMGGALRPAEKACFASHRQIVRNVADHGAPVLVLEDDAVFGPRSAQMIEQSVASSDYDLLFLNIGLNRVSGMVEIFQIVQKLKQEGRVFLRNVVDLPFFGASSYVISPQGFRPLAEALSAYPHPADPYDFFLRRLILSQALRGRVLLPFPMSVSAQSDMSFVQTDEKQRIDHVWNLFRRILWVDGEVEGCRRDLAALETHLTPEAKACATIWATMAQAPFRQGS